MPPPSSNAHLPPSQPAARQRPKSPERVLAEADAQWLYTEEELARSPSVQDGMAHEKEKEIRSKGVGFIRQVGIMLKLPELTLSTAAIFLNRFLMRRTLVDHPGQKALHHYTLGATALFLATKVEESCRKMKDIVIACCRVAQKNPNLIVDEQSKDFWKWRDTILANEDVLLEVLCFDLTIEAPHKILYDMLKIYGVQHNKQLRNAAWAFVTDSNQTQLCLLCSSRTIAAAALYCAARNSSVAFPDNSRGQPWWEAQNVPLKEMLRACTYMATNYENASGKTGPDGAQSIYVRLQESSDGEHSPWETTRLKPSVPQTITSPAAQPVLDYERTRSGRTSISSQGGAGASGPKRPYDAVTSAAATVDDVSRGTGGTASSSQHYEDRDVKKRRTSPPIDASGASGIPPAIHAPYANSSAPPPSEARSEPAGDDGSEEGEVE